MNEDTPEEVVDSRFPLGKPLNRKETPALTPCSNRPGWFKDRNGIEKYVEPPKQSQGFIISCATGSDIAAMCPETSSIPTTAKVSTADQITAAVAASDGVARVSTSATSTLVIGESLRFESGGVWEVNIDGVWTRMPITMEVSARDAAYQRRINSLSQIAALSGMYMGGTGHYTIK